jgi:hypothetical protein
MDMIELRTAHTADLDADAKAAVRRLLHGGRALRTEYVEGVAVRADRRRRGHSAVIMAAWNGWCGRRTSLLRSAPAPRAAAFT